jgi:hypothetical protein
VTSIGRITGNGCGEQAWRWEDSAGFRWCGSIVEMKVDEVAQHHSRLHIYEYRQERPRENRVPANAAPDAYFLSMAVW